VGQDPGLQQQLERKWGLAPGALANEGLIIHSINEDHPGTLDGKPIPAAGVGVILDTLERYNARHPRETLAALRPKGFSDRDRRAVVEAASTSIGKRYDSAFNTPSDREMYCTTIVLRSLQAVPNAPRISDQLFPLVAIPKTNKGMVFQEMIMTDGFFFSEDLEVVWVNQHFAETTPYRKYKGIAEGFERHDPKLMHHMPGMASNASKRISEIEAAIEREKQAAARVTK
jgi:hypothetical protein